MKLRPLFIVCAALLALVAGPVAAQTTAVPNFISYQGRVLDTAGNNVGAGTPVNRTVIFRIWDNPSATNTANLIYSESQTVTVSEGEFSVLVGQGVANTTQTFGYSETAKKLTDLATAFTASTCYLGVTVAPSSTIAITDNEISPRQQIVATAFAMRAKFAESIGSSSDLALTPLSGTATNYGLGWYGTGRLFGGTAVDGPVLYGNAGGALGSNVSGSQSTALRWDASGRVGIGATAISSTTNKLTLQGDMVATPSDQLTIRGNADNNKRLLLGFNTTANNASLQSFAALSTTGRLLLNPAGGNVGINQTAPSVALDVTGEVAASTRISIGTGTSSIASATNKLMLQGDMATTPADQITIRGNANNDERLLLGFDTTANKASLQSYTALSTTGLLLLNPSGGNVGINKAAPSVALDVTGAVAASTSLAAGSSISAGSTITAGTSIKATTGIAANGANGYTFAGTGDLDGGMFSPADGAVTLKTNGAERLRVTSQGYVGIGISSPIAPLHVSGSASNSFNWQFYMDSNGAGDKSENITGRYHSIIADSGVRAVAYDVISDQRIKEVIGVSDGGEDLALLQSIEITDYAFKDEVAMGAQIQKKVIAQQVEGVYPTAVRVDRGVVPDIFQKAPIREGWVSLTTDLKVGEKVRLLNRENDAIHEVLEVRAGAFRTAFASEDTEVFVYGREVQDFRSVDYDALSMLNISATQQLARELEHVQDDNATLRRELGLVQDDNATLRRELADMRKTQKAGLIALEQRLLSGGSLRKADTSK